MFRTFFHRTFLVKHVVLQLHYFQFTHFTCSFTWPCRWLRKKRRNNFFFCSFMCIECNKVLCTQNKRNCTCHLLSWQQAHKFFDGKILSTIFESRLIKHKHLHVSFWSQITNRRDVAMQCDSLLTIIINNNIVVIQCVIEIQLRPNQFEYTSKDRIWSMRLWPTSVLTFGIARLQRSAAHFSH